MSSAASALLLAIASATTKIVSVSSMVIGVFGRNFDTGRSFPVTFFAVIFFALGDTESPLVRGTGDTGDWSPVDSFLGRPCSTWI